ncbi:MAG: YeeE/YedE family protein [Ignavibacteriales bacterium]|nr:YeeE/YedE family protein [Ignavibacteriales bacterium]
MGPLVPEVFSNEFNLIIAFVVGICFGFILEQAGFSSTRKLVGLFYGYDFTVLKVFFTAGVTAMLGVILFSHLGWLDLSLIYINPTFLYSAIIGGLIMGLGFIIGGFCPGTSFCALAIGKIDALAFVIGSAVGVLAFMEGYPLLEGLYKAENWGSITFPQILNISPVLFALTMTLMAIGAFYFTTKIKKKVNKDKTELSKKQIRGIIGFAIVPFIILFYVGITPSWKESIYTQICNEEILQKCNFQKISTDKLAYELVNNYYKINLIDVRTPEEYKEFHLPLAINIPLDSMLNREWSGLFNQDLKKNIFYADTICNANRACIIAKNIGDSDNYILVDGPYTFHNLIFIPTNPGGNSSKEELMTYKFRLQAGNDILELQKKLKNIGSTEKKQVRKVKGGCG